MAKKDLYTEVFQGVQKMLEEQYTKNTDPDKLFLIHKIRTYLSLAIEELEERRARHDAAFDAKTQIIKNALKKFIKDLDKIYLSYEELGDTDVRLQMFNAILKAFIRPVKNYKLPSTYGMFSEEGNELIKEAIHNFVMHPEVTQACKKLKTPEARLNAFQDRNARSTKGHCYSEYFGHRRVLPDE